MLDSSWLSQVRRLSGVSEQKNEVERERRLALRESLNLSWPAARAHKDVSCSAYVRTWISLGAPGILWPR